ncbi:MAG: hypothetical protein ACRCZM_10960, partial [Bacteroidales bacterium]
SIKRTLAILKIGYHFKPDIIVGEDASVAQAAWFLGAKSITITEDDYEIIKKLALITYPFSSSIVVPSVCDVGKWNNKKIGYDGYMKLAYLHPKYFSPNINTLESYINNKKFCLIRLAKLTAFHDTNIYGLDKDIVLNLIGLIENLGYRVYISSEDKIHPELSKYQLKIKSSEIHHIMSYASLLISDSQSMSVEAAMLGVASIRFSDFAGKISVLEELESKYELTYGIPTKNIEKLYSTTHKLLTISNITAEFNSRREFMLKDKIDVTAFISWFINDYPKSKYIMTQNPNYQDNFK